MAKLSLFCRSHEAMATFAISNAHRSKIILSPCFVSPFGDITISHVNPLTRHSSTITPEDPEYRIFPVPRFHADLPGYPPSGGALLVYLNGSSTMPAYGENLESRT